MKFYNVKTRSAVTVPDSKCTKCAKKCSNGRTVYMVKAVGNDGAKLTLFVGADDYKKLKMKEA